MSKAGRRIDFVTDIFHYILDYITSDTQCQHPLVARPAPKLASIKRKGAQAKK